MLEGKIPITMMTTSASISAVSGQIIYQDRVVYK
jgi:hypothetical protein